MEVHKNEVHVAHHIGLLEVVQNYKIDQIIIRTANFPCFLIVHQGSRTNKSLQFIYSVIKTNLIDNLKRS